MGSATTASARATPRLRAASTSASSQTAATSGRKTSLKSSTTAPHSPEANARQTRGSSSAPRVANQSVR